MRGRGSGVSNLETNSLVPCKEWKDQELDEQEVRKLYESFRNNGPTSMPPHVYTVVFPKKKLTEAKVWFPKNFL